MHWAWITLLSILLVIVSLLVIIKLIAVLTLGKCSTKIRLDGKVALITGANRGIGYQTALNIAKRGAKVIITGTNIDVLIQAHQQLVKESGNKNIVAKTLNFNSLVAVRNFATDIINTESKLDILINNAGSQSQGQELTKDGMLPVMQINYFGPFLLTTLLLDLLKKSASSRIVNVGSTTANISFCFDSRNLNRIKYFQNCMFQESFEYCNSKVALTSSTIEMAKRLKGTGVTVNCLHPGLIYTKIYKRSIWSRIMASLIRFGMKSNEEGAETTIHLATCEKAEGVTGKYYSDCKESKIWANLSSTVRNRVWEQSVQLTGLTHEEMSVYTIIPIK